MGFTSTHNTAKNTGEASHIISHSLAVQDSFETVLAKHTARLQMQGDWHNTSVAEQLSVLHQLSLFELGRFLLRNGGLDARWTHDLVTYPKHPIQFTCDLHQQIYEKLPAVLATRERFGLFKQQLQALVAPGITMASIPCGYMGDLLMLDYSGCEDTRLLGIDLDHQALAGARTLATQQGLSAQLTLQCADAWSLPLQQDVDVIASNGLNIYEPDDDRVIALYQGFFTALKPGGTLVTSILTPPPTLEPDSAWHIDAIDPKALALQALLFTRIVEARWNAFRSHALTTSHLCQAGFEDIRWLDDRARMFPTVIARKPA